MHPFRTRFAKDIVTEFLSPLTRHKPKKTKVIIFCGGQPGMPGRAGLLEFFSKKGFWTFAPRYRGSWESGGKFLRHSPEKDVLDVIDGLPRGFTEAFAHKRFRVRPDEIYVFGTSFGGPAAILASRDPRVTKAVAISPVVEWRDHIQHGETNSWTERFTREAFGQAYRFSHADWKKLDGGRFYNPMAHVKEIDGNKVLIFHAKDDDVVRFRPVAKFAKLTGAKLVLLKRGGHLSSSNLMKPSFYRRVAKFLKAR